MGVSSSTSIDEYKPIAIVVSHPVNKKRAREALRKHEIKVTEDFTLSFQNALNSSLVDPQNPVEPHVENIESSIASALEKDITADAEQNDFDFWKEHSVEGKELSKINDRILSLEKFLAVEGKESLFTPQAIKAIEEETENLKKTHFCRIVEAANKTGYGHVSLWIC